MMKALAFFAALCIAGAVFALPAGAQGVDNRNNQDRRWQTDGGTTDTARSGSFEGRMETDRRQYPAGRGVEITLQVTNRGRNASQLRVTQDHPEYRIRIYEDRSNRLVWSRDRLPSGRQENINLRAGDTRTNREFWDQRDAQARPLPAGTYRIESTLYPNIRLTSQIYLQTGSGGGGRPQIPGDLGGGNGRPPRPGDNGNGGRPPRPGDPLPPYQPEIPGRPGNDGSINGEKGVAGAVTVDTQGGRYFLVYDLQNNSNTSMTYRFTSGRQFELEISGPIPRGSSSGGKMVWTLSDDRMYPQVLTDFTIAPGDRKSFSWAWKPEGRMAIGTYQVRAYLTTASGRRLDSKTTFQIR